MNWRERQALPGVRRRFSFASVVPAFVDAETGERIEGLPASGQKWKLVWPRKGAGHTFVKYSLCRRGEGKLDRREARELIREFLRDVDHPVAA